MYEGFGLPVAEALTSGTLAITTNRSALPEVGGPAAFYVQNSTNTDQVAHTIQTVSSLTPQEREDRIALGRRWVEQFGGGGPDGVRHGWDEMAQKIKQHVVGTKNRGSQCHESHWTL
jgi:glycosyltransferase involved in cell wall biosynthesis